MRGHICRKICSLSAISHIGITSAEEQEIGATATAKNAAVEWEIGHCRNSSITSRMIAMARVTSASQSGQATQKKKVKIVVEKQKYPQPPKTNIRGFLGRGIYVPNLLCQEIQYKKKCCSGKAVANLFHSEKQQHFAASLLCDVSISIAFADVLGTTARCWQGHFCYSRQWPASKTRRCNIMLPPFNRSFKGKKDVLYLPKAGKGK